MMHYRKFLLVLSLGLLAALLAACNAPAAPTLNSQAVLTQAAGTAAARLTEAALALPSPTASETPAPSATPEPATPTSELPTNTPAVAATNTLPPAATATSALAQPVSGDMASYVADVDYPDNTAVTAGEVFTKTWRIKNTGTTTWTTGYSLVCIDAGKFTCPESTALPNEVKSGETVDIKVKLTAPTPTGTHRAFFRLRNAAGQYFKLDGTGDLWVQIVVRDASSGTKPGETPTFTVTPGGSTATPTETLTPTP